MFNRNFSLIFISKIKINSAASLPEAAWICRQQSIFLCVFPSGQIFFLPLVNFISSPLCHSSSAFLGCSNTGIFVPVEESPESKAFSVVGPGAALVFPPEFSHQVLLEGARKKILLLQGFTQIFQTSSQPPSGRIFSLIPTVFPPA